MSTGGNEVDDMSGDDRTAVAADALATLANEHRIEILRVLAEADGPLAFSDLRESIGMYDTGRFNYYLSELRGRFVHDTGRGYALGHAGERVVLAAASLDSENAKVLAEQASTDGDECPVCGEENCDRMIQVHLSEVGGV
jgi:DNA-binding transcriptional ArsR family regulator